VNASVPKRPNDVGLLHRASPALDQSPVGYDIAEGLSTSIAGENPTRFLGLRTGQMTPHKTPQAALRVFVAKCPMIAAIAAQPGKPRPPQGHLAMHTSAMARDLKPRCFRKAARSHASASVV